MKSIIKSLIAASFALSLFACSAKTDPASQIVIDDITELTQSNSIDFEALEKTKERYNSLTDDQKKQVTNYADLLKLEDEYYDTVKSIEEEAERKKEEEAAQEEYEKTHYEGTDILKMSEVVDLGDFKLTIDSVDSYKRDNVKNIISYNYEITKDTAEVAQAYEQYLTELGYRHRMQHTFGGRDGHYVELVVFPSNLIVVLIGTFN